MSSGSSVYQTNVFDWYLLYLSCETIFLLHILNTQNNASLLKCSKNEVLYKCSCTYKQDVAALKVPHRIYFTTAKVILIFKYTCGNWNVVFLLTRGSTNMRSNHKYHHDNKNRPYFYCFLVEGDFCLLDLLHDAFKLWSEGQHVTEKNMIIGKPHWDRQLFLDFLFMQMFAAFHGYLFSLFFLSVSELLHSLHFFL